MHVVWDFASDVKAAGLTSLDAEGIGTGVRGRAEVGLRAQSSQGFSLDVSASYDGIGLGNYNAVSGRAVVRVPLN